MRRVISEEENEKHEEHAARILLKGMELLEKFLDGKAHIEINKVNGSEMRIYLVG